MKAIAVAALLGLSLSLDVKKDLGHAIHDAGDVASIVSTGSKIAGLIMEDEFKVNGQKVLQDAGDAAKIIGTGIDIASHFAFDIKKDIGDAVHDAGDVASIVSTGSKIAGLIMEDELKINKQKALDDASKVASVIGTGLSIADHLYVENGENAEELLNIKKIGQDIGKVAKVALPIAGSLIMEDNFKINGQKILDDASKVASVIGTGLSVADHLADDELKINKQKALNDAGDVAKIVGTGLKIADHLFVENGENAEELLNIKKIGQDIGKVAKVALPIAGSLIMEDNFKINGQKALDDASKVASVIGTGLSIADHLYVENGENAEELLNIKKIGQDIGKVAKVALPIAGSLIMEDNFKINGQEVFDDVASAILVEDNFKVNGQKVLDDASKVAGVIGTGLKIADHFAFFETESGEEKGFLSF